MCAVPGGLPGQKEWISGGVADACVVAPCCSSCPCPEWNCVEQPDVGMFPCPSDLGQVSWFVHGKPCCFNYLPRQGLGSAAPCVYLNALLVLHFLWPGQPYVHIQQCPTSFTLLPKGTALCMGTAVPYLFHAFSGQGNPMCVHSPVGIHSSFLLYLMDQFPCAEALCRHAIALSSSCWIQQGWSGMCYSSLAGQLEHLERVPTCYPSARGI